MIFFKFKRSVTHVYLVDLNTSTCFRGAKLTIETLLLKDLIKFACIRKTTNSLFFRLTIIFISSILCVLTNHTRSCILKTYKLLWNVVLYKRLDLFDARRPIFFFSFNFGGQHISHQIRFCVIKVIRVGFRKGCEIQLGSHEQVFCIQGTKCIPFKKKKKLAVYDKYSAKITFNNNKIKTLFSIHKYLSVIFFFCSKHYVSRTYVSSFSNKNEFYS